MKKILVIDDEEALRQLGRAVLTGEGYDVVDAENAETGLDNARKHLPQLILCDVNLPGMDGYQFVEQLRKDPLTTAIPVILMTGVMRDYSSVRHAMGVGADDYLLKPFSVDELLVAVRMRLHKEETLVRRAELKLSELRESIALSLPHELRTPLVSVLGFAELLKADYETMERKQIGTMAGDIYKAASRLHELIENFLIFAQIELTGADESRMKALRSVRTEELQPIVKLLSRQKAEQYRRTGDLTVDLQSISGSISDEYFRKIVNALLDNAFKFSTVGTPVLVSCSSDGKSSEVVVADRGRGMTAEQIASVGGYMQFERKMYEQQGSGLGLIIAKRLLEIHGGSLAIESEVGSGTTVIARVPSA